MAHAATVGEVSGKGLIGNIKSCWNRENLGFLGADLGASIISLGAVAAMGFGIEYSNLTNEWNSLEKTLAIAGTKSGTYYIANAALHLGITGDEEKNGKVKEHNRILLGLEALKIGTIYVLLENGIDLLSAGVGTYVIGTGASKIVKYGLGLKDGVIGTKEHVNGKKRIEPPLTTEPVKNPETTTQKTTTSNSFPTVTQMLNNNIVNYKRTF